MKDIIKIGNRMVGKGQKVLIIADMGTNYADLDGISLERAKQVVEAAARAGADAVKLQTFSASELISPRENLKGYELIKSLAMPTIWIPLLKKYAEEDQGILFFSTPFDIKSADLLEKVGVPAYKIPSAEITNIPLIEHVAKKKKPMIISTGMASMAEIRDALMAALKAGVDQIALLQCTASYPSEATNGNLRAMQKLKEVCPVVGFSDHSHSVWLPALAVAAGAQIVEKHLCLSRTQASPDAPTSLNPEEFATMVQCVRWAEKCLGTGEKKMQRCEEKYASAARKSLYASREIRAGDVITAGDIKILRPPKGLPPKMLSETIGKRARTNIQALSPIHSWDIEQ